MDVVTATEPALRGEVHLVRLDPTLGSEIRKTRPCLIVAPDELNRHLRTR
jgi:mRNA interferase MazF